MKILIVGANGLAGSAIKRQLSKNSKYEIFSPTRKELNLLDKMQINRFLNNMKPNVVINAASLVGGIKINNDKPFDFININSNIEINLMQECLHKIEKYIFLASSCAYPKFAPQPIKEDYLMSGPLETTNKPYAIAKILGIETISAINKQFGYNWVSVMPSNLYGINDNFSLESSHVLAAFIRKFYEASLKQQKKIVFWGTGQPKREFLHSDDLARAIEKLIESSKFDLYNIGVGKDISIQNLANLMKNYFNFEGDIHWDTNFPDGTPRKLLDISRISELGWKPLIELEDGLLNVIDWFKTMYSSNPSSLRL